MSCKWVYCITGRVLRWTSNNRREKQSNNSQMASWPFTARFRGKPRHRLSADPGAACAEKTHAAAWTCPHVTDSLLLPRSPPLWSSLGTISWPTVRRCTTTSTRSSRCSPWRSESRSECSEKTRHISVSCPESDSFLVCLVYSVLTSKFSCLWTLQTQRRAKGSWLGSINGWGEWWWRFHSVWVPWVGTCK